MRSKRKKTKIASKATVALSEEEAEKFYATKEALGAKSNAAVLRKLLDSYQID